MDVQMNMDKIVDDKAQHSMDEVNRVIFGQSTRSPQIPTKEEGNAIFMQTLLKQNELLMRMLVLKENTSNEVYAPPDFSKILPTFDQPKDMYTFCAHYITNISHHTGINLSSTITFIPNTVKPR
ncbi:unnamed protein product [Macrosiphum euphorbiae]|uniref:Uncharacterized protein n=1 Tax=Macrosiphum euphorbiae TaxID=13131 RepID=A0AAV0XKU1_9HEMI|nr:unnamed protein product [Macrosiphum euphorbiae]